MLSSSRVTAAMRNSLMDYSPFDGLRVRTWRILMLSLSKHGDFGDLTLRQAQGEDLGYPQHAQFRFRRAAMERAWASSPSASASVMACGPSFEIAASLSDSNVVRFMKSSTESPEEKRAERDVGST